MIQHAGALRFVVGAIVMVVLVAGCRGARSGSTTPAIQPSTPPDAYQSSPPVADAEPPAAQDPDYVEIGTPRPGVTLAEVTLLTDYWPSGRPHIERHVLIADEGGEVEHGRYTRWYQNGQKEYEATFDRGEIVGVARRWHENGQLWSEMPFVDGRRHGVCRMWDPAGNLRKEEPFEHGRPHGTWTVYSDDGKVKAQSHFEHGKPVLP